MSHHRFDFGTAAVCGISRGLARRFKLGGVLLLFALRFWTGAPGHAAEVPAPGGLLPPGATTSRMDPQTHPLAAQLGLFLERQSSFSAPFRPTGLTRQDYLKVIAGEVAAIRRYQNDAGRIIDPVKKQEMYFTTPCYAHAVAALAASEYSPDPALLESGMKAMDAALDEMVAGTAAGGHGDFFTYPVMMALALYEKVAPVPRLAQWRAALRKVDPKKLYRAYGAAKGNWAVVNLSGDYLRARAGLTTPDYVESVLAAQLANFTPLGMYDETGDPLPYDHFPRHYLGGMMFQGYRGPSFARCRDLVWRGAWTSLFMLSPTGQAPTGYRSSQHIWNEAESAVTYEIYAAEYARAGRPAEAGAFKRAARLSLRCIGEWLRPDGSGYIVKNRYPIEAQHGYESYSVHTCYNMLACSMLAQAWQFADETISERPAPCDLGGYVVPILDPFHKVFAAAGGTFAEYDTRGDHSYNPTGLLRIHVKGGHPQLGPSDGCAPKYSGKGVHIAVGPAWQDRSGVWRSLAELSPAESPRIEILEETPNKTSFRVIYKNLKGPKEPGAGIDLAETIMVEPAGVTVHDEITRGTVRALRVNYPMLVFDGLEKTNVTVNGNSAALSLDGRGVRFTLLDPPAPLRRTGRTLGHRNGMVEPLEAVIPGNTATYTIRAFEHNPE